MKLNRLIAVSVVGISLLSTSSSAFACEHDSHSWSFFGWCSHTDKDKDCDHKDRDCDHDRNRGHDCDHGGSTGGSGSSTGGGHSTGGGSTGTGSGGSTTPVGPKG
jgi:hypothetical protein